MLPVLLGLFVAYTLAVAYQARRALGTRDPGERQRQAVRLLTLTSLGIPIVIALIVLA